jgi:hypothetical protein
MCKQTGTETLVQMSRRELDRKRLLERIVERLLPQKDAARQMELSTRQVRRLQRRYEALGASGLVSRRRGKPSNRKLPDALKSRVLDLVRDRYADFGPTLANEKLTHVHRVQISAETLRLWMIEAKLWHGKVRRRAKPHPMRERRPRFGELVQIDGSPHDWFEGRAPSCTLILFVDDASNRVLAAIFVPVEATEAYMETLRSYIGKHGRPVALYADKHSIFDISDKEKLEEGELTQFGRVAKTLNIELIAAHSPEAKGRVERMFQVFQDRVIKEMRLAGVSSIEQGNAFLAGYLPVFNRRFAKRPSRPENAHRPVLHSPQDLDLIFSIHHQRTLSKNLSLQFKKILYNIQTDGIGYALRGAKVTVCEAFNGTITLLRNGKPLPYSTLRLGVVHENVEDSKTVNLHVDRAISQQRRKPRWKPAPDHPWFHNRI